MNILNYLTCSIESNNTGKYPCGYEPGIISGVIFLPKGKSYTKSQITAMVATLKADAQDASASKRIYPIYDIVGGEDKSSEQVTETYGYGGMGYVRAGKLGFEFSFKDNLTNWVSISSFNNKQGAYTVVFIDETNNALFGREDSLGNFTGFTLSMISAESIKMNFGASKFEYKLGLTLSNFSELSRYGIVQFAENTPVNEIAIPLIDAQVTIDTALAVVGTVGTVKVKVGTKHSSLGPTYATQLIAGSSLFISYIDASGVAMAVTGATYDSITDVFTVTLTVPAIGVYPVAATSTINLTSIAALTAGLVPNIEGKGATMVRP